MLRAEQEGTENTRAVLKVGRQGSELYNTHLTGWTENPSLGRTLLYGGLIMATAAVSSFVGKCPAQYKDTLFLTPKDIKNIMGIGETKVYEYLQDAPFRVERIGKLYRVHSRSFWDWYDIENEG